MRAASNSMEAAIGEGLTQRCLDVCRTMHDNDADAKADDGNDDNDNDDR